MQDTVLVLRKMAVYLDYAAAIERYGKIEAGKQGLDNVSKKMKIIEMGKEVVKEKYGNLFDMYAKNYRRKSIRSANAYLSLPFTIQWVAYG